MRYKVSENQAPIRPAPRIVIAISSAPILPALWNICRHSNHSPASKTHGPASHQPFRPDR
jgi:hypothetical protein